MIAPTDLPSPRQRLPGLAPRRGDWLEFLKISCRSEMKIKYEVERTKNTYKLTDEQINTILDRLVPLIAAPEDQEFFRGVLRIKAEESTSCEFALFVSKLLKTCLEN